MRDVKSMTLTQREAAGRLLSANQRAAAMAVEGTDEEFLAAEAAVKQAEAAADEEGC